jgi:hypothetical protein
MRLVLLVAAAALSATPAFADPCIDEITAAMGSALAAGPVRIDASIETPAGPMRIISEIVPPDAMHLELETSTEVTEVTMLGDQAWLNADGTWMALPPEAAAEMTGTLDMTPTPEQLATMRDTRCDGPTTVDGRQLLSYAYTADGESGTATNRFFIDPASKTPVRMESDLFVNGGKGSMVVSYTYDPAITVTPPIL